MGTILSPAEAIRHGAAMTPHPDNSIEKSNSITTKQFFKSPSSLNNYCFYIYMLVPMRFEPMLPSGTWIGWRKLQFDVAWQ